MVTLVKHEWHQVDSQFALEMDESLLSEIYPDLEDEEITEKLKQIENGEIDVEDVINDAWDNDVELEWDRQYDDWWTDRKGGYDITYELGDEDSWRHTPPPDPPYYECTHCKWKGDRWSTDTMHLREDGSVIEDYYNTDEESHSTKEGCPMCEHDVKLTEFGEKEEAERLEREAKYKDEWGSDDEDEIDQKDLEDALEELKREFEELMSHTIKCTECEWTGNVENCEKEGICPNCAAHTEEIERADE